jgi:hypothetical protein
LRLVLFHRDFRKFQGGHMKVFHYFQHIRSSPDYEARVRFSRESTWDETNPWWSMPDAVIAPDDALPPADLLFAAGLDWEALERDGQLADDGPGTPVVNLMQDFRALYPVSPLQKYLGRHAIRICVSEQLQETVENSGLVNGPVLTVPVGLDHDSLPTPRALDERDIDAVVVAIKDPTLGGSVTERLRKGGANVMLIEQTTPRHELLDAIGRARVAVHIPALIEGAYLPALESMALETVVVCPDVIGNRSFCRDGDTCFVPRRDARAIARATRSALRAEPHELEPMLTAGREEARSRSLSAERERLLEVLSRTDELWAAPRTGRRRRRAARPPRPPR